MPVELVYRSNPTHMPELDWHEVNELRATVIAMRAEPTPSHGPTSRYDRTGVETASGAWTAEKREKPVKPPSAIKQCADNGWGPGTVLMAPRWKRPKRIGLIDVSGVWYVAPGSPYNALEGRVSRSLPKGVYEVSDG